LSTYRIRYFEISSPTALSEPALYILLTFHVPNLMEEKRNAERILVEKLEGKRPFGRPRRRWVDNIKIVLREMR
jgi:hypothetical protein